VNWVNQPLPSIAMILPSRKVRRWLRLHIPQMGDAIGGQSVPNVA
jgi:hypothetical protein